MSFLVISPNILTHRDILIYIRFADSTESWFWKLVDAISSKYSFTKKPSYWQLSNLLIHSYFCDERPKRSSKRWHYTIFSEYLTSYTSSSKNLYYKILFWNSRNKVTREAMSFSQRKNVFKKEPVWWETERKVFNTKSEIIHKFSKICANKT